MNLAQRNQKQAIIDIFNRRADDRIQRKQTQKQLLTIIQQKNTQLSVLNHVNTRLGAELVVLQKKLGIDHQNILRQLQEINQISTAFHSQTQQMLYLDALLTAYDQNSLKQKKLIAYLYTSLQDAEKKAQNLVKDNQFLLVQLQQKVKQVLQVYSKGFIDDNLAQSYTKLQRQSQLQILQIIRTQNEYLLTHYRELQDKNIKKQKQLQDIKKNNNYYFQLYKKQSEQLKQIIIKFDDLIKIKDILQKKFQEITQENLQLQTTKQQLQTKINRVQAQRKQFKDKYQLYRTNKYQQNQRLARQYQTLKFDHQTTQKRQREYFNKSMLLQKDLQNQRDNVKSLKHQLQKTKSDFQQTLKMCETYQTKISTYSKKQQLMRQSLQDNKQKLQNILLQKDKSLLKQKQLQKIIQLLKQKNKQQLCSFKQTFQKLINEQNEKIQILQSDKQDSNSIFYQNECTLKHQIQKIKKQNQYLKQQNYRYIQNIKNSTSTEIINKLKQLQDKNQSLLRVINLKDKSFQQDIQNKNQIINNLQTQNKDIGRLIDRQRAAVRQANNQKAHYKFKLSALQRQKDDIQQQLSRVKRNIQNKTHSETGNYQDKIRQLQKKLNDSIKRQKQIKEKTIDMLNKYNQIQEEIKMEYQNKINSLTTENAVLRNKLSKR